MAGTLLGLIGREATIDTPGGSLQVRWDDGTGHVTLAGPATPVYRGVLAQVPPFPR